MLAADTATAPWRWPLALVGLAAFVFGVTSLSGPGRIDIVDGQTRFEVGRSFVEHGDSVLRDPRIWWSSYPGRDGKNYTYYRFPQSVLAAWAILMADATGPVAEGRRHFYFVLTSAAAAAFLALMYAVGFRHAGLSPRGALLWAAGGIFCTPNWFYATSTYDDILGSAVVVAAAVVARIGRDRQSLAAAVGAGLLLGLAFNVKQPLAAFLLPVLALYDSRSAPRSSRLRRAAVICAGLVFGGAVQQIYDSYKFPIDKAAAHAELMKLYAPVYSDRPLPALACFLFSPGCSVFWYCPPVVLGMLGVWQVWKWGGDRPVAVSVVVLTVVYIGYHCFVSFFKGDPAWGPRYLTPWIALLWLFAPSGATMLRRSLVAALLGLGIVVQVLGLSVDPHRLFVANRLPSGAGIIDPWIYFRPEFSQVLQAPREIIEIARDEGTAEEYTPAPSPTFAMPVIDPPYLPATGPEVVARYQVLRSFRPWWISQRFLPADERPVDIGSGLIWLGSTALVGLLLMTAARRSGSSRN